MIESSRKLQLVVRRTCSQGVGSVLGIVTQQSKRIESKIERLESQGGLPTLANWGDRTDRKSRDSCLDIFSLCLTLCLSLDLTFSLCFASSCLALVIRDTDGSRRHIDGSRCHTDGSRRHVDGSCRHTDDRVSHFRQICIRYS
eukprot:sb/3474121/